MKEKKVVGRASFSLAFHRIGLPHSRSPHEKREPVAHWPLKFSWSKPVCIVKRKHGSDNV